MKRRVITHTVTEIPDDASFGAYLENVRRAFGPNGDAIARNILVSGGSKITTDAGGGYRVTTTHTVEVDEPKGVKTPTPDTKWPLLACSREGCYEPRWSETDHLCAAHAQEAQELASKPE